MRKVIYSVASTLDGFIAGSDGTLDWLHFSRDAQAEMARFWSAVDTAVMGRRTWEATAAQSGDGTMPGVTTVVFSRTLPSPLAAAQVIFSSEDARDAVSRMKRQPGKDICVMGGGVLARSLFEADLLDEVSLNVHPLLLGVGVPLFRNAGRRIAMRLVSSRTIDGGCVLMTYHVPHGT